MKRIAILLVCLYAAPAFAECPNPLWRTFPGPNGITLEFHAGPPGGKNMAVFDLYGRKIPFPYTWDSNTCEAVLDLTPPLYLTIVEGRIHGSSHKRFNNKEDHQ